LCEEETNLGLHEVNTNDIGKVEQPWLNRNLFEKNEELCKLGD
jgi:hypothetical protein